MIIWDIVPYLKKLTLKMKKVGIFSFLCMSLFAGGKAVADVTSGSGVPIVQKKPVLKSGPKLKSSVYKAPLPQAKEIKTTSKAPVIVGAKKTPTLKTKESSGSAEVSQLAQNKVKIQDLQQQVKITQEKVKIAAQPVAIVHAQVQTTQSEIEKARAELDASTHRVGVDQQEAEQKETAFNTASVAFQQQQSQIDLKRKKLESLQSQKQGLVQQLSSDQAAFEEAQKKVATLRAQLALVAAKKLTDQQKVAAEKQGESVAGEAYAKTKAELDTARKTAQLAQGIVTQDKDALNKLNPQIDSEQGVVKTATTYLAELRSETSKDAAAMAAAKEALGRAQTNVDVLEKQAQTYSYLALEANKNQQLGQTAESQLLSGTKKVNEDQKTIDTKKATLASDKNSYGKAIIAGQEAQAALAKMKISVVDISTQVQAIQNQLRMTPSRAIVGWRWITVRPKWDPYPEPEPNPYSWEIAEIEERDAEIARERALEMRGWRPPPPPGILGWRPPPPPPGILGWRPPPPPGMPVWGPPPPPLELPIWQPYRRERVAIWGTNVAYTKLQTQLGYLQQVQTEQQDQQTQAGITDQISSLEKKVQVVEKTDQGIGAQEKQDFSLAKKENAQRTQLLAEQAAEQQAANKKLQDAQVAYDQAVNAPAPSPSEIQEAEIALQKAKNKVAEIQEKVKSLQLNQGSAQSTVGQQELLEDQFEKLLPGEQANVTTVGDEYSAAQQALQTQESQDQALDKELKEAQGVQAADKGAVDKQKAAQVMLDDSIDKVQAKLKSLQEPFDEQVRAVQEGQQNLASAKEQLAAAQKDQSGDTATLEELKRQEQHFQDQLSIDQAELDKIRDESSNLTDQLSSLQAQRKQIKQYIQTENSFLDNLRQRADKLAQQYTEDWVQNGSLSAYQNYITSYKELISEYQRHSNALQLLNGEVATPLPPPLTEINPPPIEPTPAPAPQAEPILQEQPAPIDQESPDILDAEADQTQDSKADELALVRAQRRADTNTQGIITPGGFSNAGAQLFTGDGTSSSPTSVAPASAAPQS